jgi:hypothetical protein
MAVRWLAGLCCAAAILATSAHAQEGEYVVVTASMIQSDDEYEQDQGALPYISIIVPADFVMFTVELESGTRALGERQRELEKSFDALAARAARAKGVAVEVGQPGRSAALETAAAHEAISYGADRSYIPVVLKFDILPGETFSAVRKRAEAFIDDIEVSGRTEAVPGDDQFIGVKDPKKQREDLLRKIADDTRLIQSIFGGGISGNPGGAPGISITGLGGRVKSRPVGPLEIEMFIPYTIVLGAPLPQPPPR